MAENGMKSPLQQAIDHLRIRDVFVRASSSSVADGFDPKYSAEADDLTVQFKHLVTRNEVLSLEEQEAGTQVRLFRVYIELGTRWVEAGTDDVTGEEPDATIPLALIEATFVAEYEMSDDLSHEALDAFARVNASYHVWPYWREYLMSQAVRMNLPKIALPAVQLAANRP